ncbi:MAG: LytR/AlgR family response regulator transcription factor [Flammeovirgaceae bacterium]
MDILIIEDEPHAVDRLQKLIKHIQPQSQVVGSLDSVKRAVDWFQKNAPPDLVLMDIQLADGLSFEIFEHAEVKAPIIFTTAYNEYALKAFKVNSIDYILKPVDEADLRAALNKLQHLTAPAPPSKVLESIQYAMQMLTKKYKERFVVKVGEHLKTVETIDVMFFYSLEKTTFAQTKDGRKHILDFTLEQLENLLDPDQYFRINRKYLIGISAIQDVINYSNSRLKLVLKTSDDKDIIVARDRVQAFKNWLDK